MLRNTMNGRDPRKKLDNTEYIAAAITSKTAATVSTYPFQVSGTISAALAANSPTHSIAIFTATVSRSYEHDCRTMSTGVGQQAWRPRLGDSSTSTHTHSIGVWLPISFA